MKKFTLSLKKKAFIGIVAILIPILITFVLIYSKNRVYLKNRVLDTLTVIAEAYEGQVYQFLEKTKMRARDFASDGFIRTQLQKAIHGNKSAISKLNKHLIRNKIVLDRTINTINILSLEGRVVASTNNAEMGRDLSKEACFEGGKNAVTLVENRAGHMGLSEITISTPILTKETGRPVGVLVNYILISELNKLLTGEYVKEFGAISWGKGKGAWKTLEMYLVNRDKLMITKSIFVKDAILKQIVNTLPVNLCLTTGEEMAGFYKDYRGVEVVGASMYIPTMKWVLLVEIDRREVLDPIRYVLINALITGAVAIVMIVLLFIVFIRKMVKPLRKISEAAKKIASGNFDVVVPVQTHDEIGVLCESFNYMTHHIKARTTALARSEARLAEAQRIALIGNWEWDVVKNEVSWSYEAYRIFGLTQENFVAPFETFLNHVHPDDREFVKKSVGDALANKKPLDIEHRIILKDASVRIVQERAVVISDNEGRAVQMVGTVQDITVRKHAEEAKTRLSEITETTTDSVVTATIDGRILYINKAGRNVIGIGENEDISNLSISDCHPKWASELILTEGIPDAIREGAWIGETAFLSRDGREIPISQVIIVHKNPDGTVRNLSTIGRDISERKRSEEQMMSMANRDPLTNLLNRRRFHEELKGWLAQTQRFGIKGALLFLDLDNFKCINDSLGHQAGDKFLITIADLLRARLRETDILARMGGDEFAIILPHADVSLAESVANLIRELVLYHTSVEGNYPPGISVSIGIAMFPGQGDTVETLLACADLAMYRAKGEGRNRVCVYTSEQKTQVESRLTWEKRIREALNRDGFVLFLQPIMDIRQNLIIGHEALLRMINEKGEIVAPSDFLDIAERFGLINDIDRWVVSRAIHLIQKLHQDNKSTYLEVNLSGRSFTDKQLLPLIRNELAAAGIDPATLVFEITETSVIENMAAAQLFIAELKSLGCRFALDDFGIGFSSFNYIKHLPVDYLKIDGGFVRNLPHDTVDQHLVKAMVEVARGLGKKTTAEFVENEETLRLLREYGVDYAQGYHIGKPRHVSEL